MIENTSIDLEKKGWNINKYLDKSLKSCFPEMAYASLVTWLRFGLSVVLFNCSVKRIVSYKFRLQSIVL